MLIIQYNKISFIRHLNNKVIKQHLRRNKNKLNKIFFSIKKIINNRFQLISHKK